MPDVIRKRFSTGAPPSSGLSFGPDWAGSPGDSVLSVCLQFGSTKTALLGARQPFSACPVVQGLIPAPYCLARRPDLPSPNAKLYKPSSPGDPMQIRKAVCVIAIQLSCSLTLLAQSRPKLNLDDFFN